MHNKRETAQVQPLRNLKIAINHHPIDLILLPLSPEIKVILSALLCHQSSAP
ncbi:predicted protein [Sclerotinia sclerotiorum 1980 UF-70]|uniref:Uncharacterized protein n=1 Tax=Sclerotinia sclerotiorum (strain ATCC 18683 / 1980 / Ss-1) TaxID=665079 RepID=A7F578_SCLS1|nr:predicted protein [Sclerotinia sclerotiorum 1980 UF-70]EDN97899.1 predicted protein [Sclerotinia sclerotiorum 1980 UF-70]